jgi:VIT1/CCC1 family predicted Fe2+/Mn2+ transporter
MSNRKGIDKKTIQTILGFQKNEITENSIYNKLAKKASRKNAKVLRKIAKDELRHYNEWKEYTNTEVSPDRLSILKYSLISRIFGLTFAIKMMEAGEEAAQEVYSKIIKKAPKAKKIIKEELEHEQFLIEMIDEEKLGYISSMVLGLSDALVELSGALAGLTFALQDARLTGTVGLITGIAASMSMSASEYLSQKSEGGKKPKKAAFYTGIAYLSTVLFMIFPYFIFTNYYLSFGLTIVNAVIVILIFTFFVSVVKEMKFRKTFLEMLMITIGVALLSFIIGWIARVTLNVEI